MLIITYYLFFLLKSIKHDLPVLEQKTQSSTTSS